MMVIRHHSYCVTLDLAVVDRDVLRVLLREFVDLAESFTRLRANWSEDIGVDEVVLSCALFLSGLGFAFSCSRDTSRMTSCGP